MKSILTVEELLRWASKAGITLTICEREEQINNLYVWVSAEGQVLYIGSDATGRRWKNEINWVSSYDRFQISSSFLALMGENCAKPLRLFYDMDSFDSNSLIQLIEIQEWSGSYIDSLLKLLKSDWVPGFLDVEMFLIRASIRGGKLIANTAHASLWESYLGRPMDTAAAITVADSWDK